MTVQLPDSLEERVFLLIAAYLEVVRRSIYELLDDYSCEDDPPENDPVYDVLGALREGRLPTSGTLPSGRTFAFHGMGCRFEHDGRSVEMEFTPEGCCDGFDAGRLLQFAAEYPELGSYTREEIQTSLDKLECVGAIERRPNCPLYAVKSDN